MELEERLLFEELELEEPSPRVDEEILSYARMRLHIRSRETRTRRLALAHAALGAALVVVLFILIPKNEGQPGAVKPDKTPVIAVNEAPASPLKDVRNLREEVQQIKEMTELISDDLEDERKTIEERIRVCLADLQKLEKKIIGIQDNSFLHETMRKEVNI